MVMEFQFMFLFVLALIWLLFATIQDLRRREVANWLNFSLIIFALGFRFFWSLFYGLDNGQDFLFFYQGLLWFAIFLVLGNIFYYARLFAGGDAKLLIAFGAVLPISNSFFENAVIFAMFFILFFMIGCVYSLLWLFGLAINNSKNFRKDFVYKIKQNKKMFNLIIIIGLFFMLMGFFEIILFFAGVLIFFLPYFYLFTKSVEDSCMVKKIRIEDLREGDWLYEDIRVGKKSIKVNWDGLNKKDIQLINTDRKYKFIRIKQGIPFVPVFLISYLILVLLLFLKINLFG